MPLSKVLDQIVEDLPWVDNVRLVIGPLASRESVKDALLERSRAMPSWAIASVSELAADLVRCQGGERSIQKPLSLPSQADALERLSKADFLRRSLPGLCAHLRSRAVATKVARFLTELDRFWSSPEELRVIIECLQAKDEDLGRFVEVVGGLWLQGELKPWSEGESLRAALQAMGGALQKNKINLPKKIWLWGFPEFTPLEETLWRALADQGISVIWLVPPKLEDAVATQAAAVGLTVEALEGMAADDAKSSWSCHSPWDECEFLIDHLRILRAQGVPWKDIAVFVPPNDLYKRVLRQKLMSLNVPLQDPTLSGGWKDRPRWLWWRDFLRAISTGLKTEQVRVILAASEKSDRCRALFEEAARKGFHGGAKQWRSLLADHDLPELRALVECAALFARSMDPIQFHETAQKALSRLKELLGEEGLEADLLLGFAEHLREERPYLEAFKARLPRYVSLFEEYLEGLARTQSWRCSEGLHFVSHGVWLAKAARFAFILAANKIKRGSLSADRWDWTARAYEDLEVRRIWDRLHTPLERALREEAFIDHGLQAHGAVVFSGVAYDMTGDPLPAKNAYIQVKEPQGHERVGWLTASPHRKNPVAPIVRPDLSAFQSLRISAFEDYLKCPFFYYARHVLHLEPEEEPGLEPDGRAKGNLLHNVLKRFVQDEIDGKPRPSLESAKAKLSELIEDEIRTQPLSGLFRHKPLVDKAMSMLKSAAHKWADWEYENREKHQALKPFKVEEPVELELIPGFTLKGRADRVDSDGQHQVVIDYKTGEAPYNGRELAQGLGAQLLMYAGALRSRHGLEPAAAYYLRVAALQVNGKKGVFLKKHNKKLHTTHHSNSGLLDEEFDSLFERTTQRWVQAAQDLRAGRFDPKPAREADCGRCAYGVLCGYEKPEEGADE